MSSYVVWRTFKAHRHVVNFIAFSGSGELLATGDDSGRVLIWSVTAGNVLQELPRSSSEAVCCCWGDDKELFIGYGDSKIDYYEHNLLNKRFEHNGRVRGGQHGHAISSLALHGNRLASSSGNSVHGWRVEGSTLRLMFISTVDSVQEIRTVHFVDRQSVLVTTLYEGYCILLDVLHPSIPLWRRKLSHRIGEAALSADGRFLAVTNLASGVHIYEVIPTGLRPFDILSSPVADSANFPIQTCFTEFGASVATGSDNGEVRLWDLKTGRASVLKHIMLAAWDHVRTTFPIANACLVQTVSSHSSATHHYVASAFNVRPADYSITVWRRSYQQSQHARRLITLTILLVAVLCACLVSLPNFGLLWVPEK